MKRYTVRHDGKVLGTFDTEGEALRFLLNAQSSSWDHAIRHEGYSVEQPDGSFIQPYSAARRA